MGELLEVIFAVVGDMILAHKIYTAVKKWLMEQEQTVAVPGPESRDSGDPFDLDDMQDLDDGGSYIWNRRGQC